MVLSMILLSTWPRKGKYVAAVGPLFWIHMRHGYLAMSGYTADQDLLILQTALEAAQITEQMQRRG